MKSRFASSLAAAALAVGCSSGDSAPAADVTAMAVADPALEQLRADYVTHYNQHHASMVGDFYRDSAVFLGADGSVDQGKAAIIAGLEQTMAAGPTLDLTTTETLMMGDHAIGIGRYQIAMTPPGAAEMSLGGSYMTHFVREGGAWKIGVVLTNYAAEPPAGLPPPRGGTEPPPENGTLTALYQAYTEHYNAGHASMVADLYTDDAVAMFPNQEAVQGRAAIEAATQQAMAEGSPQITLHPVATTPTLDGWAIDAGWYELKTKTATGETTTAGAYMLVAKRADDGSWKMHRVIANGSPMPAS